jgi:hypothetical protein
MKVIAGRVANTGFGGIYAMRISVLALEGLFDTGLTVMLDRRRAQAGSVRTRADDPCATRNGRFETGLGSCSGIEHWHA